MQNTIVIIRSAPIGVSAALKDLVHVSNVASARADVARGTTPSHVTDDPVACTRWDEAGWDEADC
jgi:hypothetical protein